MIFKGCSSIAQLQQISIFQDLEALQLESLVPYSHVRAYQPGEIVMQEGDRIPQQLHGLMTGRLEIKKTATNGKETLVRLIPPGELFAAPAIFGNSISPAIVISQVESQVLTIDRDALLKAISHTPEISLRILEVFNQRLQQLHNTVHGLISERAIVRLVRLIQYYQKRDGFHSIPEGDCLNIKLPYYQIARSIGITYEECVRLFKKLKGIVIYKRGGTIIIRDWEQLEVVIND
ncbi:putative transcriptional regulator, Crp/Fnr family [Hyella patelloides LEGE 07179]|uniref:Putative transcriptional regulator, Crp/Fnr family n=1 Tax=Hyella patelloides LEGE 07179 TaxID=945734 RepID=A0A563VRP3_9CYAN|nr:Crp/Fnr family transcriptional regulator [Hyella patelloides]VEP14124.1 putative transcriptional regulator, Crp/Fnr family [Hyella patelloides LEGE 07179]